MRLDPKKVKFISPMSPGVVSRPLRFVGREKTVHLQETALVVEGNLLKVGLLGLELMFRRALAEWSSVTIPYSRITRVRYVRFPLLRLLSLVYLWGWPIFSILVALGPGFLAGLTGFLIGLIPGVVAVYVLVRVPPRFVIDFRTRDGQRSRLMLHVTPKPLLMEFAARLQEFRDAAGRFRTPDEGPKRGGPRVRALAALTGLLLSIAAGVGYLGWVFVVPRLGPPGEAGSPDVPTIQLILIAVGIGIVALAVATLLLVLLLGVPWQANRRGHGFLSWFVLQLVALNPMYTMVLVALLPDRAKARLREQFARELDDRLKSPGRSTALPVTAAAAAADRSVGDLPTAGSVGDAPTAPPADRSVGDWETRGPVG